MASGVWCLVYGAQSTVSCVWYLPRASGPRCQTHPYLLLAYHYHTARGTGRVQSTATSRLVAVHLTSPPSTLGLLTTGIIRSVVVHLWVQRRQRRRRRKKADNQLCLPAARRLPRLQEFGDWKTESRTGDLFCVLCHVVSRLSACFSHIWPTLAYLLRTAYCCCTCRAHQQGKRAVSASKVLRCSSR